MKNIAYAIRLLPKSFQPLAQALDHFYQEISACLFVSQEPSIIRTKLQWWRDEISRLHEGGACQHPISNDLKKFACLSQDSKILFFSIINGFESYLDYPEFKTTEETFSFFSATQESFEKLIASELFLIKKNKDFSLSLNNLSIGISMLHYLQNLTPHLQKGYFFFSQDSLKMANCSLADLHQKTKSQGTSKFIKQELARAKAYLHLAKKEFLLASKPEKTFYLTRINLDLTLIEELEKNDPNSILTERLYLNPIRMSWISYRTRLGFI